VRSLEVLNEDGTLKKKADMFTKRTIKKHTVVSHVSTGIEALAVSLSEKAKVDMPYMCQLTDLSSEQLENELVGVIFRDPMKAENSEFPFETADAYLSGNVREKLLIAQQCAKTDPVYLANVTALQSVQPQALTASEINVRLGATWIPEEDIKQFVFDLIEPPFWVSNYMEVHYSPLTADWNISNKTRDHGNIKANKVYGTDRANAYKIIEETLNLRDVRIFDTEVDENGKKTSVLNRKETTIAQQNKT
jgi:N12 class adenine-specific DNA methylase